MDVVWIDEARHRDAEELLFARRRRGINALDAAAFVVMRGLGLEVAFAFDDDFAREGFRVLSPSAG